MEDLVERFQTIVRDFSKIPQIDTDPTWLEICRYPQSRFEEVCSRILAFYLNPNAEHRINDLWLSALLDAVGKSDWYDYRHDVKVNTEEYAVPLMVFSSRLWIKGILSSESVSLFPILS